MVLERASSADHTALSWTPEMDFENKILTQKKQTLASNDQLASNDLKSGWKSFKYGWQILICKFSCQDSPKLHQESRSCLLEVELLVKRANLRRKKRIRRDWKSCLSKGRKELQKEALEVNLQLLELNHRAKKLRSRQSLFFGAGL